jgi:hypothetical protein
VGGKVEQTQDEDASFGMPPSTSVLLPGDHHAPNSSRPPRLLPADCRRRPTRRRSANAGRGPRGR